MPKKNHTAHYLRISSADQKPNLQFDGLRRYADRAGLIIVREYLDVAVSVEKFMCNWMAGSAAQSLAKS